MGLETGIAHQNGNDESEDDVYFLHLVIIDYQVHLSIYSPYSKQELIDLYNMQELIDLYNM